MAKPNFYEPAAVIREVPGVTKNINSRTKREDDINLWKDHFDGPLEALVAAGLATADMFPGQPGRGTCSVNYQPAGRSRGAGVMGYMQIARKLDGTFRIWLNVSHEEHERRKERRKERERQEVMSPAEQPQFIALDRARAAMAAAHYVAHGVLPSWAPRNERPRPPHLRLVWSAPTS